MVRKAAEDAGAVPVPERALFIRSMVGELERIHSHLLWLGLAGHFLGFNTLWMWAWRFREDVLNVLELITGNRNHYAMMKPGGVKHLTNYYLIKEKTFTGFSKQCMTCPLRFAH